MPRHLDHIYSHNPVNINCSCWAGSQCLCLYAWLNDFMNNPVFFFLIKWILGYSRYITLNLWIQHTLHHNKRIRFYLIKYLKLYFERACPSFSRSTWWYRCSFSVWEENKTLKLTRKWKKLSIQATVLLLNFLVCSSGLFNYVSRLNHTEVSIILCYWCFTHYYRWMVYLCGVLATRCCGVPPSTQQTGYSIEESHLNATKPTQLVFKLIHLVSE